MDSLLLTELMEQAHGEVQLIDPGGNEYYMLRGASGSLLPPDGRVRAYGYPGFFLSGAEGASSSLQALRFRPEWASAPINRVPSRLDQFRELRLDVSPGAAPFAPRSAGEEGVVYVRAASHAWQLLREEDIGDGEAHALTLGPCGSVTFEISGTALAGRPELEVRNSNGTVIVESPEALNGQELGGFPVGDYSAFLTFVTGIGTESAIGEWSTFEVIEGSATTVRLAFPSTNEFNSETGTLAGTLVFGAWDGIEPWIAENELFLRIESREESPSIAFEALPREQHVLHVPYMDPMPGEGSWSWNMGEYPSGSYRAIVEPTTFSVDFEVLGGESTHLELRVPALARMLLEFADSEVDPRRVALSLEHVGQPSLDSTALSPKFRLNREGEWEALALPGEYEMLAVYQGQVERKRITLLPGWNVVEVPKWSKLSTVLTFVDGQGQLRPIEPELWEGLLQLTRNGDGTPLDYTPQYFAAEGVPSGFSRAIVYFEEPGEYKIALADRSGLRLIEDVVTLQADQGVQVQLSEQ